MNSNSIQVIFPFQDHGMWVFSDPGKGLEKEPFVSGVPAFIDAITARIPNAAEGFAMWFSANEFPGFQLKLDFVRVESGGCWYEATIDGKSLQAWFCPALFLFFSDPPTSLYAKAEPLKKSDLQEADL